MDECFGRKVVYVGAAHARGHARDQALFAAVVERLNGFAKGMYIIQLNGNNVQTNQKLLVR